MYLGEPIFQKTGNINPQVIQVRLHEEKTNEINIYHQQFFTARNLLRTC